MVTVAMVTVARLDEDGSHTGVLWQIPPDSFDRMVAAMTRLLGPPSATGTAEPQAVDAAAQAAGRGVRVRRHGRSN